MTKGLSNKGFDLDLKYGVSRENAFLKILGETLVEVKSDRQAKKTGNIYVEYENRGKPSGISTTEAEYWTYEVLPDVWVTMKASRMKKLVEAKKKGGYIPGGDYNKSRGVLIRVYDLTAPMEEEK